MNAVSLGKASWGRMWRLLVAGPVLAATLSACRQDGDGQDDGGNGGDDGAAPQIARMV